MDAPPVIRIFRFRPVHAEFDQTVRTEMVPDLRRLSGLIDVYVGRQGPDAIGDRIIATLWAGRAAMTAGVGDALGTIFHPEWLGDTTDQTLEIHEAPIDLRFAAATPTILRLFRGLVRPGELAAYVEEARAGTLADAEARHGPSALILGIDPPDRFVTLSLWADWASIESATGGDIHRPISTKDSRRIVDMDVVHYEVIPDAR